MFGQRLRILRKDKKLTMKEFGKLFSLAESTISGYEGGSRKPDMDTINKFADYFEVTTDYLLGRSDNPNYTAAEEKAEEDGELEKMLDDPNVTIAFKEFSDSPEENREKALEYLRWLNDQKKKK